MESFSIPPNFLFFGRSSLKTLQPLYFPIREERGEDLSINSPEAPTTSLSYNPE